MTSRSRVATDPSRHRFAELRQEAWRCGDVPLARTLTVLLNGHAREITLERKASYFDDHGGLWGEWRETWRSAPAPDPNPEIAELMVQREKWNHGRVKAWRSPKAQSGGYASTGELVTTYHEKAGTVKWRDLGAEDAAEILGSQSETKWGHVTTELGGGSHDLVWLRYEHHRDGYELEQHRSVMTHKGRLPARLVPIRKDAERIILAMCAEGLPDTSVGRVFTVNRKTIARLRARNVPPFPYRGKQLMQHTLTTPTTDQRLERIEKKLDDLAKRFPDPYATQTKRHLKVVK